MTVSNALPIQFWPIDQDTYNEKQVCGIEPRCWCQPIQCDDTVKIQVVAEGDENVELFSPAVFDEDGVIVYDPHGFGSDGLHSFVPSEHDICDGQYMIQIFEIARALTIGEPDGGDWALITGSGVTGNDYFEASGAIINATWRKVMAIAGMPVYYVNATVIISKSNPLADISVQAFLSPQGGDILNDSADYLFTTEGTFNIVFELQPTNDPQVALLALIDGTASVGTVTARMVFEPTEVIYLPSDAIIYKSDCLDIRTEHECTELIDYSNNKNFAGLVYEGISPGPTFSLRLPAVFFHESFPQEEEVNPLSNDTWLQSYSMITRKKNLDLGYMPYYMHQKTQLVLMHDNIEIREEQWTRRDPYNIEEAHKRYPKPKANVLLTDKNFIQRNLI